MNISHLGKGFDNFQIVLHQFHPLTSFRACQNGHLEQANCLINAGAKCTPHKTTKCTPLYAGKVFHYDYLGESDWNYFAALKRLKIPRLIFLVDGICSVKCEMLI